MLRKNIMGILKSEMSFISKIRDIAYEFKFAHQRFWRGYDDMLVWNLNSNLLELIGNLLRNLRDTHTGYAYIEGGIESSEDYAELLDEMIYHISEEKRHRFEYADNWTIKDFEKSEEKRKYHQDRFFKLLIEYYDYLWD